VLVNVSYEIGAGLLGWQKKWKKEKKVQPVVRLDLV